MSTPMGAWVLGACPSVEVDIPVTAVFLVLFVICAITHTIRFWKNLSQNNRFLLSPFLIGVWS